jgi:hypothetical protein
VSEPPVSLVGIGFATVIEEVLMNAFGLISVAALSMSVIACDDTGKAIKEKVKEVDKQEVKQDLKTAASAVGSAAEKAAKETEKAIDKVDKKAAEEIRRH